MLLYFKSETTRSDKEQLDLNPACRLLQTVFFVSGVLTEIYICAQYVVWKSVRRNIRADFSRLVLLDPLFDP